MEAEQLKILKMLEKGTISADEAQELLTAVEASAMNPPTTSSALTSAESTTPERFEPSLPISAPNFNRYRGYWRIPFTLSLGGLALGSLLLWLLSGGGWVLTVLAIGCAWPLIIVTIAGSLLSIWSRSATWVHVRVHQNEGRRINITVPAPLRAVKRGLRFARRYAPKHTHEQINAIQELIDEVGHTTDPIILQSNDEDGGEMHVYIG